jgi:ribonuclease-3
MERPEDQGGGDADAPAGTAGSAAAGEAVRSLGDVEARLGYRFTKRALLERALTHGSVRSSGDPSNERLEFLGDAVLGLAMAEHLFRSRGGWQEGELTRVKSVAVSATALARALERAGLDGAIRVGRSLSRMGRLPDSLLANVFEAIVGALFLDGGLDAARTFSLAALAGEVEAAERRLLAVNWKSLLQQLAQRDLSLTPTYRLAATTGPDHEKQFHVVACLGEVEHGAGEGLTKKSAEQAAAEATLRQLLGARIEELREGRLPSLEAGG